MLFLLQACALFYEVDPQTCTQTSDCVDAFGIGNTCQSDGYCASIDPIPRCTTTNPPDFWDDPSAYENAFVIGQMFDFTADASKLAASELAFSDILETGSNGTWLNGRQLVQISCNYENNAGDTLTEKDAVETVTDFLVNTMGVEVIVGPAGSQDSLYATNLSDGKALFISPSATAQSIKPLTNTYTDENPGLFWRTTGSDTLQSIRLSELIQEQGWSTVGIVYQDSIYGSGIGTTLRELRESETGTAPTTYTFDVNNVGGIAGKINTLMNEEGIEAVVFISDSTTDILEAIKVMQVYATTPLLLTDSAAKTELLDAIREYTGGDEDLEAAIVHQVKGTKPSVPDTSQYQEFVNRLNNVDGVNADSSAFAAHTYDATWLAVTALVYADANEEPHDINGLARGLRKISDTDQVEVNFSPTGWNQIKTALTSNETVNVVGVSGDLNYDDSTEELTTGVDLWKFLENLMSFEILDETTTTPDDTGDTEDTQDTADTDTGDTGATGDTGEVPIFAPDSLSISFHHGYDGSGNIYPYPHSGQQVGGLGELTISMISSTSSHECMLKWSLSSSNTAADANFANGKLSGSEVDGVNVNEVSVWFGYILNNNPPSLSGDCALMDQKGQSVLTAIQQDPPGFGYAPLTSDFTAVYTKLSTRSNWSFIEDRALVGLVSFTSFSGNGSRLYYPINQAYLYRVNGTSNIAAWDSTQNREPQNTAHPITNLTNAQGYYSSVRSTIFSTPFQ